MMIEVAPGHYVDPKIIRRVMATLNGVTVYTLEGERPERILIECKDGEARAKEIIAKIQEADKL